MLLCAGDPHERSGGQPQHPAGPDAGHQPCPHPLPHPHLRQDHLPALCQVCANSKQPRAL